MCGRDAIMSQRKANRTVETEDANTDLDNAIDVCVRYIYSRESSKIPIKRSDLAKHLNNVCQTSANQVNVVVTEANKRLKQVYGYKLVQIEAKGGAQYIVVLDQACSQSVASSATDPHHRRLLVAALIHIYMTGRQVKEEEMWKFLEEAGLMEEHDHATRKLLTNVFTRQTYLTYTKVGEGELARKVFEWGQRAIEEVPKMFLLNKMTEVFDKSPEYWCEQYKEAQAEAEGNDNQQT